METKTSTSGAVQRFNARWERSEEAKYQRSDARLFDEARASAAEERLERAYKDIKTIDEWRRSFSDFLDHPEDMGDMQHVLTSFLMDEYPTEEEFEGIDGALDRAVATQKGDPDRAMKGVRNKFINWIMRARPWAVQEMRDEAKNIIFETGSKREMKRKVAGVDNIFNRFLREVQNVSSVDELKGNYLGMQDEEWKDLVASNFLHYLKEQERDYGMLKDIASVINAKRMEEKRGFRPDKSSDRAPGVVVEKKEVAIPLTFDPQRLEKLTKGGGAEGERVKKSVLKIIDLWDKPGQITKIGMGIDKDSSKVSAFLFRLADGTTIVVPANIFRNVLMGIFPVTGRDVRDMKAPDAAIGVKFGKGEASRKIYPKSSWKDLRDAFHLIRIDGRRLESNPWFFSTHYKYETLE